MKNKSIFLISVLLITGCGVNPVNQYNNLQGPHKALAAAVNINGQKTGGSGWASGRTIYEARNNAINNCKKYNRNALCIVERENNNYVLTNSLNQLREAQTEFKIKQYQDYINTKKRLCKSYGFTEENAIARCVQQEISNEIANLKQQQIYANTLRIEP